MIILLSRQITTMKMIVTAAKTMTIIPQTSA
jgi:hypothetical protein